MKLPEFTKNQLNWMALFLGIVVVIAVVLFAMSRDGTKQPPELAPEPPAETQPAEVVPDIPPGGD